MSNRLAVTRTFKADIYRTFGITLKLDADLQPGVYTFVLTPVPDPTDEDYMTMTEQQARDEAKRRWGDLGDVKTGGADGTTCFVGVRPVPGAWEPPLVLIEYGRGTSWEAAFVLATKNGH